MPTYSHEKLHHRWNCSSTVITPLPFSVQHYLSRFESQSDVMGFSVMQDKVESISVRDRLGLLLDTCVGTWAQRGIHWVAVVPSSYDSCRQVQNHRSVLTKRR